MTPVFVATDGDDRGVVADGAVGARWLGRSRYFRYEVHCWCRGSIADVAEAVASPVRLSSDESMCRRVLAQLGSVPTPVWGRDELAAGGRAPGWDAGIVAARRQAEPAGITQAAEDLRL